MYGLYQIMYFTLIDIKNALCSPFFIAINIIIFYQYYEIAKASKLSKTYAIKQTFFTGILGILGGFLATIMFIYLEVKIVPLDFIYILAIAIILSLMDGRFMCLSYGGSLLTIFSLVMGYPKVNARDLMNLVGVLHLLESILILINGRYGRTPAILPLDSSIMAGFDINRFWAIPFVIFIGDSLIRPITLMAILNYSDFTFGDPGKKTILTSICLFIYSSLLLILIYMEINLILVAIYTIACHELLIMGNRKLEYMRASKRQLNTSKVI